MQVQNKDITVLSILALCALAGGIVALLFAILTGTPKVNTVSVGSRAKPPLFSLGAGAGTFSIPQAKAIGGSSLVPPPPPYPVAQGDNGG